MAIVVDIYRAAKRRGKYPPPATADYGKIPAKIAGKTAESLSQENSLAKCATVQEKPHNSSGQSIREIIRVSHVKR